MARIYEEGSHQAALFEWATYVKVTEGGVLRDYMYAIPNGSKRPSVQAAILKRQGLTAGYPDLCLAIPRKSYHGMYLELKRAAYYRITKEQHVVIDRLNRVGYCARVSNTIDKSIEMIEEYLDVHPSKRA
jgi:hypothetical protein